MTISTVITDYGEVLSTSPVEAVTVWGRMAGYPNPGLLEAVYCPISWSLN